MVEVVSNKGLNMVGLVVYLLFFLLAIIIVKKIIEALELSTEIRNIVLLVLCILGLIVLLSQLGLVSSYPLLR